MKQITIFISAFILMLSLVQNSANAKTISIDGGNITFESPKEFSKISQDIIDIKYPSNSAPQFVVGNKTAATTIAYDIKDHYVPDIKELQKTLTETFPRMIPNIVWKMNKIVEFQGREWILIEMTSSAIDTDIYNMMMVTPYNKKLLLFNFNSTKEEFPKYEKKLRKSMNSIRFH